jgi:hypothetical protein
MPSSSLTVGKQLIGTYSKMGRAALADGKCGPRGRVLQRNPEPGPSARSLFCSCSLLLGTCGVIVLPASRVSINCQTEFNRGINMQRICELLGCYQSHHHR